MLNLKKLLSFCFLSFSIFFSPLIALGVSWADYGLKFVPAYGDGSCFYYAVSQDLGNQNDNNSGSYRNTEMMKYYRRMVHEYIQINNQDFTQGRDLENIKNNIDEYAQGLEISALAQTINTNIVVIDSNKNKMYLYKANNPTNTIFVNYTGNGLSGHYDSLIPLENTDKVLELLGINMLNPDLKSCLPLPRELSNFVSQLNDKAMQVYFRNLLDSTQGQQDFGESLKNYVAQNILTLDSIMISHNNKILSQRFSRFAAEEKSSGLWVIGDMMYGDYDSGIIDPQTSKKINNKVENYGLTVGFDYIEKHSKAIGIAYSYKYFTNKTDKSSFILNQYNNETYLHLLSIYGMIYPTEKLHFDGIVNYGFGDNKSEFFNMELSGNRYVFDGLGKLLYDVMISENFVIQPFIGFEYSYYNNDKAETNSKTIFIKPYSGNIAKILLGLNIQKSLNINNATIIPKVTASWITPIISKIDQIGFSYGQNSVNFDIKEDFAKSLFNVGAGLDCVLKKNFVFGVNYDIYLNDDHTYHNIYLKASFNF
jgi:hypothetical protein